MSDITTTANWSLDLAPTEAGGTLTSVFLLEWRNQSLTGMGLRKNLIGEIGDGKYKQCGVFCRGGKER